MAKSSSAMRKGRQPFPVETQNPDIIPFGRKKRQRGSNTQAAANDTRRVECLNEAQGQYYLTMKSKTVTFSTGPAGCGKSHVAVGLACEMLNDREIDEIIITRPMECVGREMGYLPGDEAEKFDPYFAPIRNLMEGFLGYGRLEMLLKDGRIRIQPLQFIRGLTFDRAFVIMDEAQNTTVKDMQAFLTRIGKYTTVVVDGDIEQIDIKGTSGLVDAIERFKDNPLFGLCEFDEDDIVRSDIVREIILSYRNKK
jgi:phosphate starvation-inducible protein PhoH and related proteins